MDSIGMSPIVEELQPGDEIEVLEGCPLAFKFRIDEIHHDREADTSLLRGEFIDEPLF